MSLRLLPFRQYDENDVINLFRLGDGLANAQIDTVGNGDNGVFVKIATGDFNLETVTYGADSYLGKTDYPFVAGDQYPSNPLSVIPATKNDRPLGLTLQQTAKADENGEKLLYNVTKKEEAQAVLPGQTVPVATKGIFTLSTNAFDNPNGLEGFYAVGTGIAIGATDGKVSGSALTGSSLTSYSSKNFSEHTVFGTVIGTGSRQGASNSTASTIADQFSGNYIVVKIDC